MIFDYQQAKLACVLVPLVLGACATPAEYGSKFEEAQSSADHAAKIGLYEEAARVMEAFAGRVPPGIFYHALALHEAADYYAATRMGEAALAALRRCVDAKAESNLAAEMQRRCLRKQAPFARGEFITAAEVQGNIAIRERASREVALYEKEETQARPSAPMPVFLPPPTTPSVAVPRPVIPTAPRREVFDASSCLALERSTSPNAPSNAMGLRNRCNFNVEVSFCTTGDARNSYACGRTSPSSIGGGMRSYGQGAMTVRAGGWSPIIPFERSTGAVWIGCATRDGGSALPFLTGLTPPQGTCQ